MDRHGWLGGALLCFLTAGICAPADAAPGGGGAISAERKPDKKSHVKLQLLSEQPAAVPGQTVTLGIQYEIDADWHIYWRNPGDSGFAPSFDWTLPDGYTVGMVRYPPPHREVMPPNLNTFVLSGSPVLLATLQVPESATAGQEVTISLQSDWLVCTETTCLPGKGEASISLPVVATEEEVPEADEDTAFTFEFARKMLPSIPDQASYLDRVQAVASVDAVHPGERFNVAVVVDIEDGFHINAHDPLLADFISTDVFPHLLDGAFLDPFEFPAGKKVTMPGLDGPLAVYDGTAIFTMPVSPDGKLDGETMTISGVVTYQACSDETKQCFPPTAALWGVKLPIAIDGEPAAVNASVFQRGPAAGDLDVEVESTGLEIDWASHDFGTGDKASQAAGRQGSTVTGFQSPESFLGRIQSALSSMGFVGWMIMAMMGGFVLNLMPCVLPVISIKVLSFVRQAKEDRARIFLLGSAFAAGIVVSFMVLGVLILALNQTWGGLFQYPVVVIALAAFVTAFAMSLFGVFALFPPRIVNELGGQVESREGVGGAFGMGLLATLLGTACTAPFLSAAIAFASQQPPVVGFLIFVFAGLGMAFPYVLLAAQPAWVRFIPKPGSWMKTFEQLMGFLLIGTVIWLVRPLPAQIGTDGFLWTLVFLLFVAISVWLYGHVEYGAPAGKKVKYYTLALVCLVGGGVVSFVDWGKPEIPWVPYTRERAMRAVDDGYTIFVDYTADWCASCKTNKYTAIETRAVSRLIDEYRIVPFEADYTNLDPEITEDLERYNRSGVPMYLVIPANRPDEAFLLGEFLTQSAVLKGLEAAGPSTATTPYELEVQNESTEVASRE